MTLELNDRERDLLLEILGAVLREKEDELRRACTFEMKRDLQSQVLLIGRIKSKLLVLQNV